MRATMKPQDGTMSTSFCLRHLHRSVASTHKKHLAFSISAL